MPALLNKFTQPSRAIIIHCVLLALLPFSAIAQHQVTRYEIFHKDDKIGHLLFHKYTHGDTLVLKIESIVEARVVVKLNIIDNEESMFVKGALIRSSIFRKVNGKVKIDQRLSFTGKHYQVIDEAKLLDPPDYPIQHNILSLYIMEPKNLHEVYSDNFNQYVKVAKADDPYYEVTFPNGKINYFHYQQGRCTKVEVNQAFYPMEFRLAK